MEIKWQTKNGAMSICIGRKTDWYEQVPFILICREFYIHKEVCYAKWLWSSSKLWRWIPR
jgi:hypothetical protein